MRYLELGTLVGLEQDSQTRAANGYAALLTVACLEVVCPFGIEIAKDAKRCSRSRSLQCTGLLHRTPSAKRLHNTDAQG